MAAVDDARAGVERVVAADRRDADGGRAAADVESNLLKQEATRQAAAKAAGPKIDPDANTDHQRVILKPGRTYRIDVDMSWTGEVYRQDESGKVILAGSGGSPSRGGGG